MMQPVLQSAKALCRRTVIRNLSLQCCSIEPPRLLRKTKNHQNFFRRQLHHPTEKNVIVSHYKDVVIPNCTLDQFIWRNLDRWPDKTAVVCGITGRGYTYAQAHRMSIAFAASLRNKLKMVDGDCLAVMLPNSPEFPLAALGGIQAGCIVTTVNPIYTADEIEVHLINSKASAIVTTFECYAQVKKAVDNIQKHLPIILTECTGDKLPEGAIRFTEFAEDFSENTDCLKSVRRTSEDTVFLPYSSGTTGLPKGVELSHRNVVSNCLQMMDEKLNVGEPSTANSQDVCICVLPFFHIYGLVVTLLSKMTSGIKLVTVPKFQPDTFLNAQEKHKANLLYLVPPIILFLTNHKNVKRVHLDPIQIIMSGAAPLQATDVQRFLEKVKTEIHFMQGYGLTEASPAVLLQERGANNYKSVGALIPNTEAKIVHLNDENNILGTNEVGELYIRGPQIMKGYFNNPEANEDVFRPGGWMKTGDLAYYDENHFFYITERLKELIKVKGFQVAPAELEGILRSHPELADAAVIGVPHECHGETPKAFVVKKDGFSPSAEDVMSFIASKVASYKQLGDVMFVESIPKNAAGKIMRKEIKAMYS